MAVLVLSLVLAVSNYKKAEQFLGITGFTYDSGILKREQLEEFWKESSPEAAREITGLALSSQKERFEVKNTTLNRKLKLTLIKTAGDMNLVVPHTLMRGNLVTDKDELGCMLSRKAAEKLFSFQEATGESLVIGDKTYTVRGILDTQELLCVIQGEEAATYETILADAPRLPVSAVTRLLTPLAPETYVGLMEGRLYTGTARIFLFLPAWVLLFGFAGAWKTRIKYRKLDTGNREGKWQNIQNTLERLLLPILLFTGICLLLFWSIRFSDDYVPTAWSEFSFWGELFQNKWEQTWNLLKGELTFGESRLLRCTLVCMTASVGAAVGTGMIWKRRHTFWKHN